MIRPRNCPNLLALGFAVGLMGGCAGTGSSPTPAPGNDPSTSSTTPTATASAAPAETTPAAATAPSVPIATVSAAPGAASTATVNAAPGAASTATAKPHSEAAGEQAAAPEGMLLVSGGTFTMGCDAGGEEDEHPAHRVTVKSYYLDKLEVTVGEYLECVKAGKCRMYREDAAKSFKAGDDARYRRPTQPVSGVSSDDAVAYCGYVGKRLPTEAEWERAARGEDDRRFPWGNEAPDPSRHGCFAHATGPNMEPTCDVGSFPQSPGPYGHLDLAGNVWEWTQDDYDPYAYRRDTAAQGLPGTCAQILRTQNDLRAAGRQGFTGKNPIPVVCEKVLRGGAFNYPGPGLRVTNRVHHPGTWRMLVAGFRCARDL